MSVDGSNCPLSISERCPSYTEFQYSKMAEKWQGPLTGVHLREVSVLKWCPLSEGSRKLILVALVTLYYRNWDKLQPDGPLNLYAALNLSLEVKGAMSQYLSHFFDGPNYGLNVGKLKTNAFLRKKNTKGLIVKQKRTRMAADGDV